MAPVIKALAKNRDRFDLKICSSGQHREMLAQVLEFFEYRPDYDLDLMTEDQSLAYFSSRLLERVDGIMEDLDPDIVLTQGDTTTAFLITLSAFYRKIISGHVEAGLRTDDKYNPFPEEINRQLISRVADLHFAPTSSAYQNLIRERVDEKTVFLTGNTVVDAVEWAVRKIRGRSQTVEKRMPFANMDRDKKTILVTMHRRESFGEELQDLCLALKTIAGSNKSIQIVYPVHLNPNVRVPVNKILGDVSNIILSGPLDYESFIWLMYRSYFIITDSGGVQEEAPTLGKPVLVIRKKTERMESVELGISRLIGIDKDEIIKNVSRLLDDRDEYDNMIPHFNPYGDGRASEKILNNIYNHFI